MSSLKDFETMAGIHMQWEIAMEIYMNIGKQLIAHLVSKVALSGIGLIRSGIYSVLKLPFIISKQF